MRYLIAFLTALCLGSSAFGVATVNSGTTTYQTTEPTGVGSTTGWDYVGTVAGASGVYLGDGWVITCAHVLSLTNTTATFKLGGVVHTINADSIQYVVSGADLVMFQLADYSSIALASLALATRSPEMDSSLYLFGFGGGSESYGTANVSQSIYSQTISVNSVTYTSTDYQIKSTTTELVTGDSGGGAFLYDPITGTWTLTGVLEATGSSGGYYIGAIVDVASYASEIQNIMGVPEPTAWALAATGFGAICWSRRRQQKRGR